MSNVNWHVQYPIRGFDQRGGFVPSATNWDRTLTPPSPTHTHTEIWGTMQRDKQVVNNFYSQMIFWIDINSATIGFVSLRKFMACHLYLLN